jgi:hypothetical protein
MLLDQPSPPPKISPRPLGCVNAVMRDLDLDGESVVELVEEGNLIAFDISAKNSRCKDLRVLTRSVEHFRETGKPLVMEWPEIFRLLVPGRGNSAIIPRSSYENFLIGRLQ